MATFDEVYSAANDRIQQFGILAHSQLVNLADGDDELAREVREALLANELAENRFGVALARSSSAPNLAHQSQSRSNQGLDSDEIVFQSADEEGDRTGQDWWLMSGGIKSGPFDFPKLREMRRQGEISKSDLVRHTERGIWQNPSDIVGLSDVSITKQEMAPSKSSPGSVPEQLKPLPATSVTRPPVKELIQPAERNADHSLNAVPSDMDAAEYYLWDGARQIGPYSRAEINARYQVGLLGIDGFVQVGIDGQWQPVSEIINNPQAPRPRVSLQQIQSEFAKNAESNRATPRPESSPTVVSTRAAVPIARPQKEFARTGASSPKSSIAAKPSLKVDQRATQSTRIKPPRDAQQQSSLLTTWNQAANFVGGSGRLAGILLLTVLAGSVTFWLRSPPSARTVYNELKEFHRTVEGVSSKVLSGGDGSSDLAKAETSVRLIREGLKLRASSTSPAEQELLWACDYGLLPMLKERASNIDLERVFRTHMERAERLIDPAKESVSAGN